jgi:hypothetical protein
MRRFTRLTNGFSKKAENHEYMLAVYFMYYNFAACIRRSALRQQWKPDSRITAGPSKSLWRCCRSRRRRSAALTSRQPSPRLGVILKLSCGGLFSCLDTGRLKHGGMIKRCNAPFVNFWVVVRDEDTGDI